MSTVAVWSEENRTKGMVSRRCAGKVDRTNFRLGYMGGCVKKNRNTEKWYAQAKRGTVKCRLHPLIHTLLKSNLAQDIASINKRSRSSVWSSESE